mmetsp:Transcript_17504/g.37869  ORF Transcript_17504/g.37869 Transcript_17504/m.37869 type:complete len:214 (-) Transcript_17504:515-1156(-)
MLLLLYSHITHLQQQRLLSLPPFLQPRHHWLCQPLTRSPLIIRLSYPNLTHILDIHRWHCCMQRHFVKQSIQCRRKEYHSHPSPRLHLDIEIWKRRSTPTRNIVEIRQHSNRPLTTIGSKSPPIFIGQIKRIKMLKILLTRQIPSHLWQFTMLRWLSRQHPHLPQILRQVLPSEITRATCPAWANLPCPLSHHWSGSQCIIAGMNQKVAFGRS